MFTQIVLEFNAEVLFEQFLFGSGGLFAFVVILFIMFILSAKIRFAGILSAGFMAVLGITYIDKLANNSSLWFCAIFSFVSIPFLLILFALNEKRSVL